MSSGSTSGGTIRAGEAMSLGGSIANKTAGYIPNIKYSVDGSGLMLQPGTSATGPVLVDRKGNIGGLVDPNGNAIKLEGPCASAPGSGDFFDASLPAWEGYAHGTASAKTIVDSVGRVIPNPAYLEPVASYSCLVDVDASYHSPNSNNCDTFNFPADNLGAEISTLTPSNEVTVPFTFCYEQTKVSMTIPKPNGSSIENETINEIWWVLSEVVLPNGTSWKFFYDQYGQVSAVYTPTGAVIYYLNSDQRISCGNPPGEIPVTGTPVWPFTNLLSSMMTYQKDVVVDVPQQSGADAGQWPLWTYDYKIGTGWTGAPPSAPSIWPEHLVGLGGPNEGTVTVRDPEGNDTVHFFTLQNISGESTEITPSICGPYETRTQYYQGSAPANLTPTTACTLSDHCLKEVDTTYTNTGTDHANPTNFSNYIPVGVLPNLVTTTLTTGTGALYSQDQYSYDEFGSYEDYIGETHPFSFGLTLSSSESDFTSSVPPVPAQLPATTTSIAALRTTLHTKEWQSNYKYYEANLIDLPCLETVFPGNYTGKQPNCAAPDATTASATQAAQTSYTYDEPSYTASAGLGNLTTVTRWLSGGTNPETHTSYTSYGMPSIKWDADGNKTYFYYDSSNLFLNQIKYADTSSEYPQYDDSTGLLLSNTDVNGNKTSYVYDNMRRLTMATYPDTAVETLTYHDWVCSNNYTWGCDLSVVYTKTINSGPALTKTAVADGLGRLVKTVLNDPNDSNPIVTFTNYYGDGKVASVTNPYRTTADPTFGTTYYYYDALGRKPVIRNPDGTTKQSCFNGVPALNAPESASEGGIVAPSVSQAYCNLTYQSPGTSITPAWEFDTDENGNTWQRMQDGLGRMTYVYEPKGSSPAPTMETGYTYDILNNLLYVSQYGQTGVDTPLATRNFHYDTLSRLYGAFNPESGLDTYVYDANSNVLSKTYPAINGVAGTQTLYYAYDCMNRLVSKWIGSAPTQPGCTTAATTVTSALLDTYTYGYPGTLGNAVGRLIQEQSYNSGTLVAERNGTPAYSGNITYDKMGRLQTEQQIPYGPGGTAYPFSYTYDLAGNPITAGNGLTAATSALGFTFGYDAADRLQTVQTTTQPSTWTPAANYPPLLLQANAQTKSALGSDPYDPMGHLTQAQLSLASTTANAQLSIGRSYDDRGRITSEVDSQYSKADSATTSTGQIDVAGTYVTGDSGSVVITLSGGAIATPVSTASVAWTSAKNATPALLAAAIEAALNTAPTSTYVTASLAGDGTTILLNSASAYTGTTADFNVASAITDSSTPSYRVSSTDMAGGLAAVPIPSTGQITIGEGVINTPYVAGDSGSVVVTLSGGAITTSVSTAAVDWNSTTNNTPSALAAAIEAALNTALTSTYVTATLSSNGVTILLSSNSAYTGTAADFNLAATVTDTAGKSPASYTATTTSMAGGVAAATTDYGPIYSYLVPAGGYAPNGNLLAHVDSVIGPWTYTYDTLNRLTGSSSGAPAGAYYAGEIGCWQYDGFGNRKVEAFSVTSGVPCGASSYTHYQNANYSTNNHITAASISTYDLAGNVLYDMENYYLYDPEDRLCAVYSLVTNTWTQYLYDAEGLRVGKGTSTMPAPTSATPPTSCLAPTAANGFTLTNQYLLGLGGEQVTELTVSGSTFTPLHTNVFVGSHLLATYDFTGTGAPSLHFPFTDPLGSKRTQASPTGALELTCYSLPFGNNIPNARTAYCPNAGTNTLPDDTEQHFTGKERDTESGNDYFGARYYSSAMGRFMSPDWSAKVAPVPYAKLGDPQTLNLYAYVDNNPLIRADADGHDVIYKGTDDQRKEEMARTTSTMNSGEKALFSMKKGKDGQEHMSLDSKAAAAYKGAHTKTFDFMAQAVKSPHTIGVQMAETVPRPGGKPISVANDAGGGVTAVNEVTHNSEVYLSPGGNPGGTLPGASGGQVPDPVGLVAEHEVLGHARLAALGQPHGEPEAVGAENQMRRDVLMAPRAVQ